LKLVALMFVKEKVNYCSVVKKIKYLIRLEKHATTSVKEISITTAGANKGSNIVIRLDPPSTIP
jgi:hypothetical protein